MSTVLEWQRNIDNPDPKNILETYPGAAKAAVTALEKHLDRRSERTTSSTERFLQLALAPFGTPDGELFSAGGYDIATGIREAHTVYLLASESNASAVGPLLTLFADEWFQTGRAVAIADGERSGGEARLPVPAVGVLDELRGLVPIPSLPQVAYELRGYGIGLVYGVQNASQETELYGHRAETLDQNVQCTIVGGYDRSLAQQLTDQAGEARVASASVDGELLGDRRYSESTTYRSAITAADQQQLRDGESVMRVAGVPLFYGAHRDYRDERALRRAIAAETASVAEQTAIANATARAAAESRSVLAEATWVRPEQPAAGPMTEPTSKVPEHCSDPTQHAPHTWAEVFWCDGSTVEAWPGKPVPGPVDQSDDNGAAVGAAQLYGVPGNPNPWNPGMVKAGDRDLWIADMTRWVDHLNRVYGITPTQLIPACWPLHTALVWELATLRGAWLEAFVLTAATGTQAASWHERTLPRFYDRLPDRLGSGSNRCRAGVHADGWNVGAQHLADARKLPDNVPADDVDVAFGDLFGDDMRPQD